MQPAEVGLVCMSHWLFSDSRCAHRGDSCKRGESFGAHVSSCCKRKQAALAATRTHATRASSVPERIIEVTLDRWCLPCMSSSLAISEDVT